MGFSFFPRVQGGGGDIRGRQIAKYLESIGETCRINPKSGYENDVCIFILGGSIRPEPKYSYYDLMDAGSIRYNRVRNRSRGGIIANSLSQYDLFREMFQGRTLYLIPQHHCNIERKKREKREVRVVGCIGGDSSMQWNHAYVERMLNGFGMEFRFSTSLWKRERNCDFYLGIDINVRYRPISPRIDHRNRNVLSQANAGSFGIPTVMFPEPSSVQEWGDAALYAEDINQLVMQCNRLREDPVLYDEMSKRSLEKAEKYHIENIARLYRQLPGASK